MAAQLIVSADDFGASREVNAAVARAYREGALSCAGLMVTGEAAHEAVELARDEPGLAVGLHLTLSNGLSALAPEMVPDLVDAGSRFANSPLRAAMRYYFSSRVRRQLELEINAQFEGFAETGLQLSHVDGHQHLHAHPSVLGVVIGLARLYGARGIRVPRDPLWANLQTDRSRPAAKALVAVGHAYLARACRKALPGSGLVTCEAVVGSLMSGAMNADYTIRMLSRLNCRSVEVFFHPCEVDVAEALGPNKGDLETLLDARLAEFIEQQGYELTNYAGLMRREAHCELG